MLRTCCRPASGCRSSAASRRSVRSRLSVLASSAPQKRILITGQSCAPQSERAHLPVRSVGHRGPMLGQAPLQPGSQGDASPSASKQAAGQKAGATARQHQPLSFDTASRAEGAHIAMTPDPQPCNRQQGRGMHSVTAAPQPEHRQLGRGSHIVVAPARQPQHRHQGRGDATQWHRWRPSFKTGGDPGATTPAPATSPSYQPLPLCMFAPCRRRQRWHGLLCRTSPAEAALRGHPGLQGRRQV